MNLNEEIQEMLQELGITYEVWLEGLKEAAITAWITHKKKAPANALIEGDAEKLFRELMWLPGMLPGSTAWEGVLKLLDRGGGRDGRTMRWDTPPYWEVFFRTKGIRVEAGSIWFAMGHRVLVATCMRLGQHWKRGTFAEIGRAVNKVTKFDKMANGRIEVTEETARRIMSGAVKTG